MKSAITLTSSAIDHVRSFLAKYDGAAFGLRVGVKPTGCSGYKYVVEVAEGTMDQDLIFEDNGLKIVVDKRSLQYLEGSELDFVHEGFNSSFKFNNPNVQDTCGCGESFSAMEKGRE